MFRVLSQRQVCCRTVPTENKEVCSPQFLKILRIFEFRCEFSKKYVSRTRALFISGQFGSGFFVRRYRRRLPPHHWRATKLMTNPDILLEPVTSGKRSGEAAVFSRARPMVLASPPSCAPANSWKWAPPNKSSTSQKTITPANSFPPSPTPYSMTIFQPGLERQLRCQCVHFD